MPASALCDALDLQLREQLDRLSVVLLCLARCETCGCGWPRVDFLSLSSGDSLSQHRVCAVPLLYISTGSFRKFSIALVASTSLWLAQVGDVA